MDISFVINSFFQITDILSILIWGVLIYLILFLFSRKYNKKEKQLLWGLFFFKLIFVFAFIIFYAFISKGGDTLAYWINSQPLSNVFKDSPAQYMGLLSESDPTKAYFQYFNNETGYPWARTFSRDSNFVAIKITSIFHIATFGSYIAGNLFLVLISTLLHWKLYHLLKNRLKLYRKRFIILFLFMPSFPFWCAGVSKDTYITLIIISLTHIFFSLMFESKKKITFIIYLLVAIPLIYIGLKIRSVIIIITILPVFIVYLFRLINKISVNYLRIIAKSFVYLLSAGIILVYITLVGLDNLLMNNDAFSEAIVKQQDFQNNQIYGDNKYDLGFTTYSSPEIIQKLPLIITTGIYRPFIWEALSVSLIINGIESIIYFVMSIKFLIERFKNGKLAQVNISVFNFSGIFVFFMSFIAGFISILYGVLVRFRAPLLPFLGLILSLKSENENN